MDWNASKPPDLPRARSGATPRSPFPTAPEWTRRPRPRCGEPVRAALPLPAPEGSRLRTPYPLPRSSTTSSPTSLPALDRRHVRGRDRAFGGPAGMVLAHRPLLRRRPARPHRAGEPRARERCVLLLSTDVTSRWPRPLRVGDVWARLAALRPRIEPPARLAPAPRGAAMQRLMPATPRGGRPRNPAGPSASPRFHVGTTWRGLPPTALTRGLRATSPTTRSSRSTAPGTSPHQQAGLAWLGRQPILRPNDTTTAATALTAPNLNRVEPGHHHDHRTHRSHRAPRSPGDHAHHLPATYALPRSSRPSALSSGTPFRP